MSLPPSGSESPSMPGLVTLGNVTVALPPPLSLLAYDPVPRISIDQQEIINIVMGVLTQKPDSKTEALEAFHALQVKLGAWLVSRLPAAEQKAILVGLWATSEVESVVSSGCFGFLKK